MKTIDNFLTKQQIERINAAVAAAELGTSGEIKVLVVQKSSLETDMERELLVEKRAAAEFVELGLDHTRDNTGILFMISLDEKRVAVAAGQAINDKITNGVWQRYVDVILDGIKTGHPATGICQAIIKAGVLLAKHLPIKADDTNEIPNEVVFKA